MTLSFSRLARRCLVGLALLSLSATESFAERHLYIGHSFFRPSAVRMPFHATQAGIVGHTQDVVFAGGGNGAPLALWNNPTTRAEIQGYLDDGDVDLFAMTYHGDHPTSEGYENWITYALAQNSSTRFVLALPWPTNPESTDAATWSSTWHDGHDTAWHNLIGYLRGLYPGTDIKCLPYGQATTDLRLLFAAGNLPDVNFLRGPADDAIVTDTLGHPGDITTATTELVWARMIFGIDMDTYAFDPGYTTDLKAIAEAIMDDHDATWGGAVTTSTTLTTTTTLPPVPGCPAAPLVGCRTAEKSQLQYRDDSDDSRDRSKYKWTKGAATTQAEFGNPLSSTHLDFCIYASGAQNLYFEANVPPGVVHWKSISGKGFKYRDSDEANDGTQKIQLKGHDTLARSKIQWKGAGAGLPDLPISLPLPGNAFPLLVQVSGHDTSVCFETEFELLDVDKNDERDLKLKQK